MGGRPGAKILMTVQVHIEETKNIAAHKIKQKIFFYPFFLQCCYYISGIFIASDDVKNRVIDYVYLIEIVIGPLNTLAYLAPQFQMIILKTFGVWFGLVRWPFVVVFLFYYGFFVVVVVL